MPTGSTNRIWPGFGYMRSGPCSLYVTSTGQLLLEWNNPGVNQATSTSTGITAGNFYLVAVTAVAEWHRCLSLGLFSYSLRALQLSQPSGESLRRRPYIPSTEGRAAKWPCSFFLFPFVVITT